MPESLQVAPGPPRGSASGRLVCLFLEEQELGVAIEQVKETIALRPITRVPLVPDFVAGLINLRGEVVAVLDLARLLGLPARPPTVDSRIVILRGRSPGRPVSAGLLVDRVSEVRDLAPFALHPPPSTVAPEVTALLAGVARVPSPEGGEHPLLVLDLDRIFDSELLRAFRRRA